MKRKDQPLEGKTAFYDKANQKIRIEERPKLLRFLKGPP